MSMGKPLLVWALMGSIALAAVGCDKLGLGVKKEASSKGDDDDDDSDSKSKKKKKHHKKSSDDDDDDSKDSKKDSKKSATNPLPPSSVTPVTGERFAGVYRSTWGDVTVHQTGSQIDCAYPAGTMTCSAAGVDLDCTWKEGASATGKAKLKKLGNETSTERGVTTQAIATAGAGSSRFYQREIPARTAPRPKREASPARIYRRGVIRYLQSKEAP